MNEIVNRLHRLLRAQHPDVLAKIEAFPWGVVAAIAAAFVVLSLVAFVVWGSSVLFLTVFMVSVAATAVCLDARTIFKNKK